jgi:hypothetical protein
MEDLGIRRSMLILNPATVRYITTTQIKIQPCQSIGDHFLSTSSVLPLYIRTYRRLLQHVHILQLLHLPSLPLRLFQITAYQRSSSRPEM